MIDEYIIYYMIDNIMILINISYFEIRILLLNTIINYNMYYIILIYFGFTYVVNHIMCESV